MVNDTPLITTIIPMHNAEKYIAEAIESALDQGDPSLEILVIDDGSTDRSAEIVEQYADVTMLHQENAGLGATLNRGIELANGELLAFLDADDRWTPGKLLHQRSYLNEHKECDACFGHVREFSENGTAPPQAGLCKGTMLVWRTAFHRVGPFNTDLAFGDFIDWYARAQESGFRTHLFSEVFLERRIHDDNTVHREPDRINDYAKVMKAILDRRRANNQRQA